MMLALSTFKMACINSNLDAFKSMTLSFNSKIRFSMDYVGAVLPVPFVVVVLGIRFALIGRTHTF